MGRYLKVQGNLILMSTDIEHSMSKILPCEQQIIPVSLKRKIAYKGYYIEEWVDVAKIEIYFNWLKKNNPFFKDMQLNKSRLAMYEQNLVENIEEYLKTEDNSIDDEINKSHISDRSGDECEEINETEFTKPIEVNDEINIQYYDSIMCINMNMNKIRCLHR